MASNQQKAKLPKESEDHVVEVSLRHVIILFCGISIATLVVGTTLIVVKDYSKIKRQQAFFDGTKEVIKLISNGDNNGRKQ
jgi:hypothetical protein